MFSLQIVEEPHFHYTQNVLDEIAQTVSKHIQKEQNGILNIVFVDAESIQNLNKKYRGKNTATDVLSFHYFDDFSLLSPYDTAGEIVLLEEKVITQGEEYGLGSEKEFYKLVLHSMLHILGFDHETDAEYQEMKDWEEMIWRDVFGEEISIEE